MKISVLCSDFSHPVYPHLLRWYEESRCEHEIQICARKAELNGGDLLFLISCSEIIGPTDRVNYQKTLVVHASDLPRGRGWSPHIWEIIGGAEHITLSLLEAEDKVDSGDIWKKELLSIEKHCLWDEINEKLFKAEIRLINFAIAQFECITPMPQSAAVEPSYYPKRQPLDSKLDPKKTIAEQFDLIRVCDPNRFPAFFELHGHKYSVKLEKINE